MKVRLPEGSSRDRRPKTRPRREPIACPTCGSQRLVPELAFIAGARYLCKDCGFRGALVVSGMKENDRPSSERETPP